MPFLKTIFKEIENEQNVLCRAGCGLGCSSSNLAGNNTLPPAPYWILCRFYGPVKKLVRYTPAAGQKFVTTNKEQKMAFTTMNAISLARVKMNNLTSKSRYKDILCTKAYGSCGYMNCHGSHILNANDSGVEKSFIIGIHKI